MKETYFVCVLCLHIYNSRTIKKIFCELAFYINLIQESKGVKWVSSEEQELQTKQAMNLV